ncbi:MAG: butyrate kinase [Bacteroidales bacterium]
MSKLILAINPGSTSTKIAVFQNDKEIFLKNIKHSTESLKPFKEITDQYEFRKKIILDELEAAGVELEEIAAVVGRGGLIKPIPSGVYNVNKKMLEDLKVGVLGQHASNLGGLIANDIAKSLPKAKAFIADPVVVDEMQPVARIAGHPNFQRISIFHALNQKAIARTHAKQQDQEYEEINLIVAHMGGGISVGAHQKGRVIDVNNALDGDGPFSPERSGSLPSGQIIKLCFSEKYTLHDMKQMIKGKGGLVAYLQTNDAYDVEKRAENGEEKAALIQEAMAYQIAKEIGALSAVLEGKINAILLTGGIAYGKSVVESIKKRVKHLAPVFVYPGEDEMKALAMNGLRVLKGDTEPLNYE